MRKDYEPGVLAPSQKSASELDARDAFNREHPPLKGLVVPYDLRKMELPERPWRNNRGQWFDLAEYEILNAHLSELKPAAARSATATPPRPTCTASRDTASR